MCTEQKWKHLNNSKWIFKSLSKTWYSLEYSSHTPKSSCMLSCSSWSDVRTFEKVHRAFYNWFLWLSVCHFHYLGPSLFSNSSIWTQSKTVDRTLPLPWFHLDMIRGETEHCHLTASDCFKCILNNNNRVHGEIFFSSIKLKHFTWWTLSNALKVMHLVKRQAQESYDPYK